MYDYSTTGSLSIVVMVCSGEASFNRFVKMSASELFKQSDCNDSLAWHPVGIVFLS